MPDVHSDFPTPLSPGAPPAVDPDQAPPQPARTPAPPPPPPGWQFDCQYDGGDRACGDLILELRQFFAGLAPGARVRVIAHDPGAWIDIPAWCRVTGHTYLDESPPSYLIERK